MATDFAPVTPEVMAWARLSVGVTEDEAAKRAGVPPGRLLEWETGESEPTLAKLRALAALYQRPLSIFFLPEPPRDYDTLRDFRRLPGLDSRLLSRPLHKVYRRAVEQQEIAAELIEGEDDELAPVTLPSAEVSENAETVARRLREALDISLTTQWGWTEPDEAFRGWLGASESLGVLVLRTSDVAVREMRGFSISGDVPAVVVNALDWPRGQAFTLMHELAHLMIHEAGICNLLEDQSHDPQLEAWCNAVAAAALMPADEFSERLGPKATRNDWSEEVIAMLSARWSVSQEAIVRRLLTLGYTSQSFYETKRAEYAEIYEQRRTEELERRRAKKSKGGPPPARMTARDRGKPWVRLVLDAYHRDALSPASTSAILGLKVQHFHDLEHEVRV